MFSFRGLVLFCFCVGLAGFVGCGKPDAPTRPPADDGSLLKRDGAIRNVVFQGAVQTPDDGGSMLPEAVRGFWGNGKPEQGIDGEDTMKWANETFEALKSKGLTTANDASGWVTQDFKNMNAWEYKVVQINATDAPNAELTLNRLGVDRWECFHVHSNGRSQMFYFKKRRKSFLKSLPTADLMRLVPMMRGE